MADKKKPQQDDEEFTLDDFAAAQAAEEEVSEADLLNAAMAAEEPPPPAPVPQPPDMDNTMGEVETFLNKATDAIPLGRLASNLGATALRRLLRPSPGAGLTPQARAELEAMGGQVAEQPGLVDIYRDTRDTRSARTTAGEKQNPIASGLGTGTGLVASILAPLPKFSAGQGAGVLGRIGAAGKTGAAYGALSGLTDGGADLTHGDVGGAARDALLGGTLGFGLGAGVAGLSEAIRPLAAKALRNYGVQQAKQAIQGGSDIAAATRKPLSNEAAQEALESGAIRPLSTTPATYERLQALVDEQGASYNRIISELEAMGVTGPRAQVVADELLGRASNIERQTLNESIPQEYLTRAEQLVGKAAPDGNLGLTQAENLKRSAQEMARYGRIEETPLNEARREIASVIRQANEDAISAAADAPGATERLRTVARSFVPVKQRLGRLLEAEGFAAKGAAKAEQRSPVGLKDVIFASGAGAGNPLATAATAAGTSFVRNRLPSTLASGAYGLGRGLETGTTAADIAAVLGTNDDVVMALIEALRRRGDSSQPQ